MLRTSCLASVTSCFASMTSCFASMTSCFASLTSCFASTTSCGRGTTSCFASLTSCFASTSSGPRCLGDGRHAGDAARYFSRRFALLLLICFPLFPVLQKPTSKDTKRKKRLQTKKQQLLRASGLRMVVVHQKLVLASPAIEFFAALRAAFPFPCYK